MVPLLVISLAGLPAAHAGSDAEKEAEAAADLAARRAQFDDCEPATADRLAFVEHRLAAGQTYAKWWYRGFTTFYALGTIVSSVDAGLEDDSGQRADAIVGAVKALIGTTRLLIWPPIAKEGADPVADLPTATEADCRARLTRAEDILRQAAKEADSRYSWIRHAGVVGLNVAGGLIVAEGFGESDGWINAGVGIAVGEAFTWSHPWRASSDLEDYEREYGTRLASLPPVTWNLEPTIGGAMVRVRF
jgi:hypothetical protein